MSALAAGIAASAATLGSLINSSTTNSINESTKNWQSNENRYAREWQEVMYNKYYSPQATKRQLIEAGINPAISGDVGAGGSMPSPVQTGSPAVGFPHVDFGANEAINAYLQSSSVSAQNASYRAQSVESLIKAGTMIAKDLGESAARDYFKTMLPSMVADQKEQYNVQRSFDVQLEAQTVQNEISKLNLSLDKKYSDQERSSAIDSLIQNINESIIRGAKIQAETGLTEQQAFALGAQAAKDFAQSKYYYVLANQTSVLTPLIAAQYGFQNDLLKGDKYAQYYRNGLLGIDYHTKFADFEGDKQKRDYIKSDEGQKRRLWNYQQTGEGNYINSFIGGFTSALGVKGLNVGNKIGSFGDTQMLNPTFNRFGGINNNY